MSQAECQHPRQVMNQVDDMEIKKVGFSIISINNDEKCLF